MKPRYPEYSFRALAMMLFSAVMLVGTMAQCASAQSRTDRIIQARAEAVTGDRFPVYTTTQRGIRIYAVRTPSAEMLRAIDDGFTELFTIASRHGYRMRLNYSDYTVYIARADRSRDSSGGYSPDVAVSSGQYAGSVYDKGGYIFVAGMVLELNHCIFVLAEHDTNLRRVSDIVRYEGEHLILYHNDRALYQKTADHSRGGGHPILQ